MTQRATQRVPILSIWWDPKQEEFVNLDLFQTTANYSSFLSLCFVTAFHSIFLSKASSLISKRYVRNTVESKQGIILQNSPRMWCNNIPIVSKIWFLRCLIRQNIWCETAKASETCNKKKKNSLQREVSPGSHPSKYSPRLTEFDFEDRTSA